MVEQTALSEVPEELMEALADAYRLERPIGRGGMATIYLAEDLRHGRQVAVKVLRPDLPGYGELPERFLREVRFAARLVHPHILPVHDSGRAGPHLYYVMPYLSGESLRERLDREGTLAVDEAIRITRAVASALDYAHRQGIVHRDIKPENILLVEEHPVVADFGIARAIRSRASTDEATDGAAIGTPEYMSPEQVAGDVAVDGRSDLYSLACVLYEMLTGKPPFAGLPAHTIMLRHLTQEPASITTVRPTVPPSVAQALARALAKEPEARFASVGEFAEVLGVAPAAPGPTSITAAARDARAIAVLPFANLGRDSEDDYLSDGITEELISALAHVEGLYVASRTSVYAQDKGLDAKALGARLNVAYLLEGTLRRADRRIRVTAQLTNTVDGRLLWSGRYDRELEDVLAIEEDLARTIVATLRGLLVGSLGDPVPKRYTQNARAYHLYLKGRHAWNQRSQKGALEAIRYFEQALAEDPNYALAHTGLSDSYAIQIDYRGIPVAEGMARARAEAQRALQLDDSLAEAHTSLAWVTYIHDWNWAEAERQFRRAIELNPGYATARQWYAWLLLALGRRPEALNEGRMAVALEPASVSIQRSLGWLLQMARRPDEALPQLQRALALDPGAEETHRVIGLAHLGARRWDDAEAAFREALALSPHSHLSRAGLGASYALAGRRPDAEGVLAVLEQEGRERYVSPVAPAIVTASLADSDAFFGWLERAWLERRGWLTYLRVQPLLDPVRPDPRFAQWLERMRLN